MDKVIVYEIEVPHGHQAHSTPHLPVAEKKVITLDMRNTETGGKVYLGAQQPK